MLSGGILVSNRLRVEQLCLSARRRLVGTDSKVNLAASACSHSFFTEATCKFRMIG